MVANTARPKERLRQCAWLSLALWAVLQGGGAQAACSGDGPWGGPLHMDHCDEFEGKGIFSRRNQRLLDGVLVTGALAAALWEGTDSERGRSAWKSVDAMATAAVVTEVGKALFQRPRPSQSVNPNLWRQGSGNKSFPSGETAMVAAFVTPLILDNQQRSPAVWALAALPVYMAKARMGSQGHWLSDVVAGAAVGVAAGYLADQRETPLILAPLPGGGAFIGIRHRF
jgi:undecaprenyl-diphosphatase